MTTAPQLMASRPLITSSSNLEEWLRVALIQGQYIEILNTLRFLPEQKRRHYEKICIRLEEEIVKEFGYFGEQGVDTNVGCIRD